MGAFFLFALVILGGAELSHFFLEVAGFATKSFDFFWFPLCHHLSYVSGFKVHSFFGFPIAISLLKEGWGRRPDFILRLYEHLTLFYHHFVHFSKSWVYI